MSKAKYSEVLTKVRTKFQDYQKKKKATDRLLASDFNFLDFFKPGENKVSEILAFLLNPHASHGQGDQFLREFLKSCRLKEVGAFKNIRCEKPIDGGRKPDVWIEFSDFTIAIENKIWAYDQANQLLDYASFLKRQTGNNFLLIYLNPYGLDPSEKSILKEDLRTLKKGGNIQIWSYKKDIFELLEIWSICCEAEKVTYFILQFKEYLKTKITGNNSVMTKEIKEIIYENPAEAALLVNTYNNIRNSNISKVNEVANNYKATALSAELPVELLYEGPFNFKKYRVFKVAVIYNGAKLWIQLLQDDIKLKTNYYEEADFDPTLLDYLKAKDLDRVKEELAPELSKLLIVEDLKYKILFIIKKVNEYHLQKSTSVEGYAS